MQVHTDISYSYAPIKAEKIGRSTGPDQNSAVALTFDIPKQTESSKNSDLGIIVTRQSDTEVVVAKNIQAGLKSNIDGAVIRIFKNSVRCELYTEPRHRIVNLPMSFFPSDKLKVGLPINLRVDQDSGIRRPVVKIREVPQGASQEGADFFDNITF